ncbi:MAG: Asp-tRNA(Asn)/Glu-tRNA(Gln) amidotransferase subunit GatA, partial [bacterium]|nr:Asp-tRNA(Asn)/Glu-tRNA(Gln) amidotransferase subunit GatA [bacterium]
DKEIHAYLSVFEERAIREAERIQKKILRGEKIGVLAGIPCSIKDNILFKGEIATAGSKILKDYIASYDATVVNKLQQREAVILGKTNLDEFAMGSSTENSAFGPTKNPLDLGRVPGGSSGGAAASVAAGMCQFALGSDTGGSIRQPASFCGVVGLKPTYGAVSRFGLMAMASSLDQIGPLARNVEDAALVFDAISGRDEFDSTSTDIGLTLPELEMGVKDLRVGVPSEYFGEGIDPKVEKAVRAAIKTFEELGAKIEEVSLPHSKYALASYYIIQPAEVSANLARYDGIKYGFRARPAFCGASAAQKGEASADNLLNVYLKTRKEGFGAEVRRRIMLGTYTLSAGYYDAYYLKAQKIRRLIKEDFDKVFKKVDIILTPTSPTLPFKFGERAKDPLSMYLADIYTVSVNLAGAPAISIPCATVDPVRSFGAITNKLSNATKFGCVKTDNELRSNTSNGVENNLSVGLQIIGKHFDEAAVLKAAYAFEQNLKPPIL